MAGIFGAQRRGLKRRSPRPLAPFPPLPIELIRIILELVAIESHSAALLLTLVSKLVHGWITPLLFRTVTLPDSEEVRSFHDSFVLPSPSTGTASHVKNLFMRCLSDSAAHSLARTLGACSGVDRLVLDSLHRRSLDLTLSWPAPWEVVFIHGANSWVNTSHPILRNVTHLHLDDVLFWSTLEACKNSCPRLTHIGISHQHTHNNQVHGDNFVRLIRWLLATSSSLEMVLLHTIPPSTNPMTLAPDMNGHVWHELSKIEDERLLARPGLEYQEYCEMLKTGRTVWDDARVKYGNWRELVANQEVTNQE